MRLKKWLTVGLSVLTVVGCLAFGACGDKDKSNDSTPAKVQTITIPTVTVDLVAPENKVEVSATEKSEVYDANGKKLTAKEWLLNSKFSKEYIRSLGVGEYTFTYKSATKTGTITLIVTDDADPDYVFLGEIPETLSYMETTSLPALAKNQDSYQTTYEPSYSLTRNGEEIEYLTLGESYKTYALLEGEYVWNAVISAEGEETTFRQSFTVQTFEEYDLSKRQEMLFDEQLRSDIPYEDGAFHINLANNTNPAAMFNYTVDWEVTDKAILAGKTRAEFKFTTNTWFSYVDELGNIRQDEHAGTMWVTNSWQTYLQAIDGNKDFDADRSTAESPVILQVQVNDNGTEEDTSDDTYTYTIVAFLKRSYFDVSRPLQLSFANACTVQGKLEISFS